MVRPPYFDSNGVKKGSWSKDEDDILRAYVERFGHPSNWRLLPFLAGIPRCGKSCRLRWMNYLRPGLKRGNFSKHEDDLIIKLHHQLGNKWSAIAANFPGRTDNEIKNYWHAHIEKRGKQNGNGKVAQLMEEQDDEGAVLEDLNVVSCSSPTPNMSDTDPYLVNAHQVPDHQPQTSTRIHSNLVDQDSYYDIGMHMIHTDMYSQPELLRIWSQQDIFYLQLW